MYLLQSGLWLSDYPFVDRSAFLDLSLAVERQRQQQTVEYDVTGRGGIYSDPQDLDLRYQGQRQQQAEYDVAAVRVDAATVAAESGRGGIYSDPRDLDLGGVRYGQSPSQPPPPPSVSSGWSSLD